jgi:HK97 family phage major capsid protein
MSNRKDLPNIAPAVFAQGERLMNLRGIVNANTAGPNGRHPAEIMAEAVEAVGSQVKEHRTALDTKISEIQASLQNTQQVLAKIETMGGGAPGLRGGGERVSAKVLAEAESSLESLRNGTTKSVRMSISTFFPQAATITSGDLYVPAERDSEVYGPLRRPYSVRDLLITRQTGAPSIEYLRGTRTGSAAIQAAEGDAKAELAMDFDLLQAPVKTIAAWIPASRQVLDDASMLGDYIDLELRDALRLTEDAQLLKGNGTGANILGLWSVATSYNRGTGTAGAVGASDKPLDTMRRAITQLQLARGMATGIVVNPIGLEKLELEKDAEGRYMMSFDVTDSNGRATVWRVPAVVTDAIGADEWMLGDFTRAARLYDRQQATVEVATQHADFFTRNLVAILAEERVALTVNRPSMLIIGTFAPVV